MKFIKQPKVLRVAGIVIFIATLLGIIFYFITAYQNKNKMDDGKMLPILASINVRENEKFPLDFCLLTNNGSNLEFLNKEEIFNISTDAENIFIEEYDISKSTNSKNPYIYSFQTTLIAKGSEPIEIKELIILTSEKEYKFAVGNIKIQPYQQSLDPQNEPFNPDNMKIVSNRAASHQLGIGNYNAEYSNQGTAPAVVKQIVIDPAFEAFQPQVYVNGSLIPDPNNINVSIAPKENLEVRIKFQKQDSPYDVFYFAPTIVLKSSTMLRPNYAVSGVLIGGEDIKSLYGKYFKG